MVAVGGILYVFPVGLGVVRGKTIFIISEGMTNDSIMVNNLVVIFILKEGYSITSPSIDNSNVIEFGVDISILKPIYTGS